MRKRIRTFEMISVLLYLAILTWIAADVYADDHVCSWEETTISFGDSTDEQHIIHRGYQCSVCGAEKTETVKEAHEWEDPVVMYEDLSAGQHKVITQYYCTVCGYNKEETKKEAHDWGSIECSNVKCLSAKQHSCTELLACGNCYRQKKERRKEKHRLNDFNVCEICEYVKKGAAVTLKPGKAQKVNQKTWCKIKVNKRGYLTVKTKNRRPESASIITKRKNILYWTCAAAPTTTIRNIFRFPRVFIT